MAHYKSIALALRHELSLRLGSLEVGIVIVEEDGLCFEGSLFDLHWLEHFVVAASRSQRITTHSGQEAAFSIDG